MRPALCMLLSGAVAAWCADRPAPAAPVALDQLPEPVRRQIASQGVFVDHIEQQTSSTGATIYAVYLPRGGAIVRALIDADGRLLASAPLTSLPGPPGEAPAK